jgi:hypothetical protein
MFHAQPLESSMLLGYDRRLEGRYTALGNRETAGGQLMATIKW